MNNKEEKKQTLTKKLKKLTDKFSFINIILGLSVLSILLIFIQILFFRTPLRIEENRIQLIQNSIQKSIDFTNEEVVIVNDNRIESYTEFKNIVDSIDKKNKIIIPSGKLLKEWFSTAQDSIFTPVNSEELLNESEENPYSFD